MFRIRLSTDFSYGKGGWMKHKSDSEAAVSPFRLSRTDGRRTKSICQRACMRVTSPREWRERHGGADDKSVGQSVALMTEGGRKEGGREGAEPLEYKMGVGWSRGGGGSPRSRVIALTRVRTPDSSQSENDSLRALQNRTIGPPAHNPRGLSP